MQGRRAFLRNVAAFSLVGARTALAAEPVLVPKIDGDWWQIAGSPDVGPYTTDRQQPVDFAVWQAADGTWQLWSCIRSTSYPGWTRLLYRWEGVRLTDRNWKPMGIAMTADTSLGEVEGMLQAPHVIRRGSEYLMFYGAGDKIALATSRDGKNFQRRITDGKVGIFGDGFGTRDPMTIRVGGKFLTYYSANPGTAFNSADASPANRTTLHMAANADLVRTSSDLKHWSAAKIVAQGGEAGTGPYTAECPFVHFHRASGYYYLFRTQHYGENSETRVYRSKDPMDFGAGDDRCLVTMLPVAAPEIVEWNGQTYIAALLSSLKGIQIARLGWAPKGA